MDLAPDAIAAVVYPTAAFTTPTPATATTPSSSHPPSPTPWSQSALNPLFRINSLSPHSPPHWRIDGCTSQATQFFIAPTFPHSPLRIDTFIPPPPWHGSLAKDLDQHIAFAYRDASVARLGVGAHVLRILEHYSATHPRFEKDFKGLPFGSRIMIEELHRDVRKCRVKIMRNTQLEHLLLSLPALAALVPEIPNEKWPELVDIAGLRFERQLHDSVTVVTRTKSTGRMETLVLKALNSSPKYLYHELVSLLSMERNDNIIHPLYLATKLCSFGGKVGIVGMLLPYHHLGSLRDELPLRALKGELRWTDQVRWARELTGALVHVVAAGGYYSDLRVDNVVLASPGDRLVLLDFEQRGVWSRFAAPEVEYLENVATVAKSEDVPKEVAAEFQALMEKFLPGWNKVEQGEYKGKVDGYALGWLAMGRVEREAAMVYMLGRALWCIFEGVSMPEKAVWRRSKIESELEFPEHKNAKTKARELVDRCTIGRVERRREGGVTREEGRIVMVRGDGTETEGMVREAARVWWKEELEIGRRFLEGRERRRENGEESDFPERPKLEDVLKELESWEAGN